MYSKKKSLFYLWLLVVHQYRIQQVSSKNMEDKYIIPDLHCESGTVLTAEICIPYGYRKEQAPANPTLVTTKFEIDNIVDVNDKQMMLTIEFYMELTWTDHRIKNSLLQNDKIIFNNKVIEKIWKPDLWIKNLYVTKIHRVIEETSGLLITNEDNCDFTNCTRNNYSRRTLVIYNFEARATIYCNFNLIRYPMDIQICDLVIDSAYPITNVVSLEFELGLFAVTSKNKVLNGFDIEVDFDSFHNQSGLHGIITMRRNIFPYIIKYYLPCSAIIMMACLSFFMTKESGAILGRMALLVTQFLTLTNILMAETVNILICG